MEIIETIDKQIKWYYENSAKANINQLIDFQNKLAGNSYFLATVGADTSKEYNLAYKKRKFSYCKGFIMLRAAKTEERLTVKDCDQQSLESTEKEHEEEIEKEYIADLVNLKMRAIEKVLIAVSMTIKNLQNEKISTNKTQV